MAYASRFGLVGLALILAGCSEEASTPAAGNESTPPAAVSDAAPAAEPSMAGPSTPMQAADNSAMQATPSTPMQAADSTPMQAAPAMDPYSIPPGEHRDLVMTTCTNCHDVNAFLGQRRTREQWAAVIDDMYNRGLVLSNEDYDKVLDYFATAMGPQ